jgi:hypothetical protein
VGNQDFPGHLSKASDRACEQTGRFRGGGGPLVPIDAIVASDARVPDTQVSLVGILLVGILLVGILLVGILGAASSAGHDIFGFKLFMHFSFYLMIAALVLVGFEVAYALYQLTMFVL